MDVTPLISSDRQVIQSYRQGRFRVSGRTYEGAVLVFPDHTEDWSQPDTNSADISPIENLKLEDFAPLFDKAGELDVVLLGCWPQMEFISPAFKAKLKEKGLVLEVMDTGAACRTYNVLMAEGRRVVAAMLPAA